MPFSPLVLTLAAPHVAAAFIVIRPSSIFTHPGLSGSVTIGVINNVDKAGEEARIGEATAVMEKFQMTVCPQVIRHRPEFQAAAEKGKAVTELGAKGKVAASEIRALWDFLDRRAAVSTASAKPKRKPREAKP